MIQSKWAILFESPTFWTIVAIFAYNGLSSILPMLSGNVAGIVNVILLVLAGYAHASHVQSVQASQA